MNYFTFKKMVACGLVILLHFSSIETKKTVAEPTRPLVMSHWFSGFDELSTVATSKKKKVTPAPQGCDAFENCTNCFCDSLCWKFDDCCGSFLANFTEKTGVFGSRLPSNTFTCKRLPGYVDEVDNYSGPIYVITKCSDSFPMGHLRDGCERGSDLAEPSVDEQFYSVPVSSRTSGLVFRNLYCALCHGELNTSFWTVLRHCNSLDDSVDDQKGTAGGNVSLTTLMNKESVMNDCKTIYKVPHVEKPRRCVDSINICPSVRRASIDSTLCQRENSTLYVYTPDGASYRNKYCAACYGYDVSSLVCKKTAEIGVGTRNTLLMDNVPPFSIILDLNTARGFVNGQSEQRLGVCPTLSVYDPFANKCRVIVCPFGSVNNQENVCRSDIEKESVEIRPAKMMSFEESFGSLQQCPLISLNFSEYRMLENGSIFVAAHEKLYDVEDYRVHGDDLQNKEPDVYICSPFTNRNYTEPMYVGATLGLEVVGGYLSLACSIISLVGLAFQFAVYMLFSVLRNRPGQLVLCLIVSLFVGQLLFLLVNQSSGPLCYIQAATMHFSYLAAFLWMNVMAIDVYRTFSTSAVSAILASTSAGSKRFVGYSLYAWGITGSVVMTGVLFDQLDIGGEYRPHYGRYICWFGSRLGQMVFFAAPLGVVLVANIVLFFGSVVQIHRASKATRIAVQKPVNTSLVMIYAKLSVVLGLGWMIGFLAAFTDWSPLWYIFIVCNSLQGAFICIAFVFTKQVMRLLGEQCLPRATSSSEYATSSTAMCSTSVTGHKTLPVR